MNNEREFSSSEFADAETTTEYDPKTGNTNVEKCVNGKCEKFVQFKNGTLAALNVPTAQ